MSPRDEALPARGGPSPGASARLEATLTRTWLGRGPLACALWPLSIVFRALTALHRTAYRVGLRTAHPLPLPVLVVGNRIAGGAGKTPTVLALLEHLRGVGWRPGVISRGHGGVHGGVLEVQPDTPAALCGDEPLLIRLRGGVPVVVGRDRVAAGAALIAAHPEVDLLIADDGLQHLRLARQVEVVVFDARGAGNGWLLPAGPLREPIDARSTAGATLLLYNAPVPSTPLPGHVARSGLAGAVELGAWRRGDPATPEALERLHGRPLRACAAIAQPQRFFDLLGQAGLAVEGLALPDHASFEPLPWPPGESDVIVTEKDAVKLDPQRLAVERPGCRVWVTPLDFRPAPAFLAALDAALESATGAALRLRKA